MDRQRIKHRTRQGFTLVELLVVIALITILVALSGASFFRFMNLQAVSNTQSHIETIMRVFKEAQDKVVADSRKATDPPSQIVLELAGNDVRRAKVIWTKARLMEAFPTSYKEINTPTVYQPITISSATGPLIPLDRRKYNASYVKALGGVAAANKPESESAACLAIALTTIKRGSGTTDLKDFLSDSDGDGIRELVDVWSNPYAFFLFPTEYPKLNQYAPTTTNKRTQNFRDPLDPDGTLVANTWSPILRQMYEQNNNGVRIHKVSATGGPPSYYVVPVLVSAGLDRKMGLGHPNMSVTDPTAEVDNLHSFRYKLGGQVK